LLVLRIPGAAPTATDPTVSGAAVGLGGEAHLVDGQPDGVAAEVLEIPNFAFG